MVNSIRNYGEWFHFRGLETLELLCVFNNDFPISKLLSTLKFTRFLFY